MLAMRPHPHAVRLWTLVQIDSYQYRNNTLILFATQYKNDNTTFHRSSAVFGGLRIQKKELFLLEVQSSTDKKLATTQDRQTLQNSEEKQYCQDWMLRLVVNN